jgi:hypothetical protein
MSEPCEIQVARQAKFSVGSVPKDNVSGTQSSGKRESFKSWPTGIGVTIAVDGWHQVIKSADR